MRQCPTCVVRSARKFVDLGNIFELPVPCCSAREADMCIRSHVHHAVETSSGYDKQGASQLEARQCRSTAAAEAPQMPRRRKLESPYEVLPGAPRDRCRRREKVRRVGRSRILATPRTMAKEEALERSGHFEGDASAQARADGFVVHFVPHSDRRSSTLNRQPGSGQRRNSGDGSPLMFAVGLGNRDMELSAQTGLPSQTGRPNLIHCRVLINSEPESGALISPSSRTPCCTAPSPWDLPSPTR